jgi:hypothetical protein
MKRIYTISGLLLLFTFFTTAAFAQNITVKGKVTDAKWRSAYRRNSCCKRYNNRHPNRC